KMPNDIYRTVLEVAMKEVEGVANGTIEYDGKLTYSSVVEIANEWLRLETNRSLTKKSVMTLPYGSTQMTCRDHVASWLRDLQKDENKAAKAERREPSKAYFFGDSSSSMPLKDAISFMSAIIWRSIGKVVIAARAAMKFIKATTSIVAKMGKPLIFTAPTGFITYQEIFESKVNRVETQLMGATKFTMLEPTKVIDYHRMLNSSAPNFVHTHDAAHLTWSTNGMEDAGIESLAIIHDSFGTHACNTDKLNSILRASAIEMYSEYDVITNFLHEQEDRLCMAFDTVQLPKRGTLNLNELMESKYAFA
ncbi:MAG: DNA-directed RNA polymerase, partial [Shewanella oncorhynchi]